MFIINYKSFILIKQEAVLFFPTSVLFLMLFPLHPQGK